MTLSGTRPHDMALGPGDSIWVEPARRMQELFELIAMQHSQSTCMMLKSTGLSESRMYEQNLLALLCGP